MIDLTQSEEEVLSSTGIEDHSSVRKMSWIECIIICLFSIFYIDFEVQDEFRSIIPIFIMVYLGVCCLQAKMRAPIIKLVSGCFIVALLFEMLTDPITIEGTNVVIKYLYSNFSQYLLMFFPIVLLYRIMCCGTSTQQNIILATTVITGFALTTVAVQISEINPEILHSMNSEALEDAEISLQGFNYVYAFTFLIITCAELLKKCKSNIIRIASIGIIIYIIYFMSKMQFALAFVTTAISLLYLYYITASNKENRVIVVIIGGILIIALPSIMKFLIAETADLQILNERLIEINDSILGESSGDSDMKARFELYGKCIDSFLASPIWGNRYLPFNGHSTFLLAFAYLGILGGIFICWLFYKAYKYVSYILGDKKEYFKPLMCQIILMGLTNPINDSPSNFIMLFCVCPLLIQKYVSK